MKTQEVIQQLVKTGGQAGLETIQKLASQIDPKTLRDIDLNSVFLRGDLEYIKFFKNLGHPLHLPGQLSPFYASMKAKIPGKLRVKLHKYMLKHGVDPRQPYISTQGINTTEAANTCVLTPIGLAYISEDKETGNLFCSYFTNSAECQFFKSPSTPPYIDSLITLNSFLKVISNQLDSLRSPVIGALGQPLVIPFKIAGNNLRFEAVVIQAMQAITKAMPIRFVRDRHPNILTLSYSNDIKLDGAQGMTLPRFIPTAIVTCQYETIINSAIVDLEDLFSFTTVIHELLHTFGFDHPLDPTLPMTKSVMSYPKQMVLEHAPLHARNITDSQYWRRYERIITPMSLDIAAGRFLRGPVESLRESLSLNGAPTCTPSGWCFATRAAYTNVSKIDTRECTGSVEVTSCENKPILDEYHQSYIGAQVIMLSEGARVEEIITGKGDDTIFICPGINKVSSGAGSDTIVVSGRITQEFKIADFDVLRDKLLFNENCHLSELIALDNATQVLTDCNHRVILSGVHQKELADCFLSKSAIRCGEPLPYISTFSQSFVMSFGLDITRRAVEKATRRLSSTQARWIRLGADCLFKFIMGGFLLWVISATVKWVGKHILGLSDQHSSKLGDLIGIIFALYQTGPVSLFLANTGGAIAGERASSYSLSFLNSCSHQKESGTNSQSLKLQNK